MNEQVMQVFRAKCVNTDEFESCQAGAFQQGKLCSNTRSLDGLIFGKDFSRKAQTPRNCGLACEKKTLYSIDTY